MSIVTLMPRRISQLRSISDVGQDPKKFNDVIVPCGNLPAGYEYVEAITLGDIISVLRTDADYDSLVTAIIP